MRHLKQILVNSCMSYTVLILPFSLMNIAGLFPDVNSVIVLQLFLIMFCIMAIKHFADQKFNMGVALHILADIAIIYICVFGLGLPIGLIPMDLYIISIISIFCLVIYILVYGVFYIQNAIFAASLNKKLAELNEHH